MNFIRNNDRNYLLFLLSTAFVGIAQSVDGATLTNYLKDGLGMMILQRSALEFPRELPGLLMVGIIGALAFLGDTRTMLVGNLLSAIGMFALGVIPPQYSFVVMSIFVYNIGTHIYMPLSNSLGMSFASASDLGKSLGRMNAVNTATLVISSALLWLLFKFWHITYMTAFTIGSVAFLLAAIPLFFMAPVRRVKKTSRFIFRKEYRLYYWLSVLYGARKQIFITFGPWVLVDIFHQQVTTMTMLFFIVSITGIFVKPWIGHLIDHYGEKLVLGSEAIGCFVVCLGYAFADNLFSTKTALLLICLCYVLDQVMNAVSMARATYMRKIALVPEDISPSLSLGTSIDHLVTMFLPIFGGLIWYNSGPNGYKYVFIGGAVIALLNFISTRFIQIKEVVEPATTIPQVKPIAQTYLLIAGAWHTSWFWHSVQKQLEDKGHTVISIDLPGHGNNKLPLSEQNLESYARFVATIIKKQSKPVILVGHSMAGAVACQTAEYEPRKIRKLVILCGFLLENGESINGLRDGIKPTDWRKIAEMGLGKLSEDKKISYITPALAKNKLYGDLTEQYAELAINHLSGEAIAAQEQAVNLSKNFASVPKIYIKTLKDQMLPLELQNKMSLRNVEKVYTLHSGHSPFLTAPLALSDILLAIGYD